MRNYTTKAIETVVFLGVITYLGLDRYIYPVVNQVAASVGTVLNVVLGALPV